jgi:hypothetical protein
MQTSTLSSAVLSAYSTVNASAVLLPVSGGTGFQADGLGQASFNVDFTVSTPTAFNLTGDVTGNAIYHLGRLEIISADVTLSGSSSGSLYSVGFAPTGYTYPGESFNDPVSFSTTLLPGQTYTLNAAASVDSGRDGVGETNVGPASASFEFAGIVPEPDCLAAIVIVPMLLRRKPQKTLIFQ